MSAPETPAAVLERVLAEIPDAALALRVRLACVACVTEVRDREVAASAAAEREAVDT